VTTYPPRVPPHLQGLVAALRALPGLTILEAGGTQTADRPTSSWLIRFSLPKDVERNTLTLLETLVSRAEWRARGIALAPPSRPSGVDRVTCTLSGAGEHARADELAALIRESRPARPIRADFAALTGALNRVNAARNEVGSLSFHLRDPLQGRDARKAYHLIVQAEALLESLRSTMPVYDEDEGDAGQDPAPPPTT
jgi:hypothetical protein